MVADSQQMALPAEAHPGPVRGPRGRRPPLHSDAQTPQDPAAGPQIHPLQDRLLH